VNEAFAYVFLALDLIVGAVVIYAVVAFLWWLSRRVMRSVRPTHPADQGPRG
jgi:hypothetical protein